MPETFGEDYTNGTERVNVPEAACDNEGGKQMTEESQQLPDVEVLVVASDHGGLG